MEISHEESFGTLILQYKFHLKNNELQQKIDQKKLAFVIHIECSLCMYRQQFLRFSEVGKIFIDSKNLNDKVEVLPLIIAIKDLPQYQNSNLHPDYEEADIFIPRGAIMGVSDYCYFFIDKDKSNLGKKDSIFSFVKNQKNEPMKIETDNDKISIILKEEDFNQLQMLQSSNKYRSIIYSIFIVPALIYALDSIDEDLDFQRERLWFRSLEQSFKENNIELNQDIIAQKTSYRLVQLILEDPISKALLTLNEIGGDR